MMQHCCVRQCARRFYLFAMKYLSKQNAFVLSIAWRTYRVLQMSVKNIIDVMGCMIFLRNRHNVHGQF